MQDFLNNFSEYKNCVPPGVRLPQIEIESKYYKSLKPYIGNEYLCDENKKTKTGRIVEGYFK